MQHNEASGPEVGGDSQGSRHAENIRSGLGQAAGWHFREVLINYILSSPGRVHMAQIQIEKDYLTSSFSILEEQPMDMLLGLDMLKKHQCTIDLKRNVLVIGTTGTETPFLAEADLPPCARLSSQANEEDAVRSSAKEAKEAEDRQLAEAIAR